MAEIKLNDAPPPDRVCAQDQDDTTRGEHGLAYLVNDNPPWYLCVLLGFQHYLTMFGSTVAVPFVIAGPMCFSNNPLVLSEIISTIFFTSGMCTLIQTTVGTRLPIVQGATFAFLGPTFAILQLDKWKCPSDNNTAGGNSSNSTADPDAWKSRMNEIQGAIMVSSCFQMLVGFTGYIGFVLRFIGPLTIAPTVTLVGLALFTAAADFAGTHWGISALTMVLIIAFSQYLKGVDIPVFVYHRNSGCTRKKFSLFRLFPIIMAIVIAWIVCVIITAAGGFPASSKARTDTRISVLYEANWFRFPYPGQWGTPTVSVEGVFGMLAGVLASMIESIGDYYACARLSGAPPPPTHAVNRGIAIEGIGCLLAGAWGSGNGTTSYSENIGAIGITKVGSRRVIQVAALIMLFLGMFGKFGALFTTIPDPIVGGVFMVMFGMITAVGLSNLQFVDMNSSRNLFVLGFSLMLGMALPHWMRVNGDKVINTGSTVADQIIKVLLTTNMFVAGLFGCIFDNTVPGTLEERGMIKWRSQKTQEETSSGAVNSPRDVYNLPWCLARVSEHKYAKYIPFLPYYPSSPPDNAIRGTTNTTAF